MLGSNGTFSENEQEILTVLRKDEAMTNAMMEVAKVKKVINYLESYKPPEEESQPA